MKARQRYNELESERQQFLDVAVECSRLTLPYLIQKRRWEGNPSSLQTPWQSVGAKSTVTLAC